jgi:UDP-N-acetylmuramate--alanine ligase
VGISGTHGKTTTTVMTTEALTAAGLNPTGIAGGRVGSWGGNARVAGDDLFVVEADEFDKAFLTLYPTVAVVNNVEPDHLECYGSMAALEDAFAEFAGRARVAIINADDAGARRIGERVGPTVRSFGCGADADIRISEVVQQADFTQARIVWSDGRTLQLRLKVPGLHNLRNAVAALAAVDALGGALEPAAGALGEFQGVGRRFERLGEFGGVAVVDDYAHHPSELAATLSAARQAFPGRRLVAVFQPHLYSRTAAHGEAMGEALAVADLVFVTEIYPAREQPIAGVSGQQVAAAAERAGADTRFEPTRANVGRNVYQELRAGDVVLTLGAGDITRVAPELVRWLSAA